MFLIIQHVRTLNICHNSLGFIQSVIHTCPRILRVSNRTENLSVIVYALRRNHEHIVADRAEDLCPSVKASDPEDCKAGVVGRALEWSSGVIGEQGYSRGSDVHGGGCG